MKNVMEKAIKNLGMEAVKEMENLDKDGLNQVILSAVSAMQQVRDELEANAGYQELLESKKAMESSKREVDARQKLRIALALHLLQKDNV
jgi:hypothetical protein